MEFTSHRMPATKCPACGYEMDGAANFTHDNKRPKPGDFSVCCGCGEFLRFTDDLALRLFMLEDITDLHGDNARALVHVRTAIRLRLEGRGLSIPDAEGSNPSAASN